MRFFFYFFRLGDWGTSVVDANAKPLILFDSCRFRHKVDVSETRRISTCDITRIRERLPGFISRRLHVRQHQRRFALPALRQ